VVLIVVNWGDFEMKERNNVNKIREERLMSKMELAPARCVR
jgi:hypothetical protein